MHANHEREESRNNLYDFNQSGNFDRPYVSVDILIFATDVSRSSLKILLHRRKEEPFSGCWSFPGRFVDVNESAYVAACKELQEQMGLEKGNVYLEQLYTFTQPDRDPRMRVIDIAYMALSPSIVVHKDPGDGEALWFDVKMTDEMISLTNTEKGINICYDLEINHFRNGKIQVTGAVPTPKTEEKFAFDHAEILYQGIRRLRSKILYTDVLFNLLPKQFLMKDIMDVYSLIMGKEVYQQQIKRLYKDYLLQVDEYREGFGRPKKLYEYRP
ncbi:MAG: NUDIX domain-containing protein [Eubacteriales bacterium]|nr:NUDIX domain-containing protein [Eubacteriales bacterium]